jgi:hypothetical protein
MPSPPSPLHPNSDQYPPKCYHCNVNGFSSREHYESHGIRHHVGLTLYPGPADLKALGLEPQGMQWEKDLKINVIFGGGD